MAPDRDASLVHSALALTAMQCHAQLFGQVAMARDCNLLPRTISSRIRMLAGAAKQPFDRKMSDLWQFLVTWDS